MLSGAYPIETPPFVFPNIRAKRIWVLARRREGQTLKEIALQLGVSAPRVRQIILQSHKPPRALSNAHFRAKNAKPVELGDQYDVWFHYDLGPGALA